MLLKLLLIIGVIAAVYFFFFKSKSVETKEPASGGKSDKDEETVECAACGTYITLDDALIKEGRYYCSQECLEK